MFAPRYAAIVASSTSGHGVGAMPKVVRVSESSMTKGTSNWYSVFGSSRSSGLNRPRVHNSAFGTVNILSVQRHRRPRCH